MKGVQTRSMKKQAQGAADKSQELEQARGASDWEEIEFEQVVAVEQAGKELPARENEAHSVPELHSDSEFDESEHSDLNQFNGCDYNFNKIKNYNSILTTYKNSKTLNY